MIAVAIAIAIANVIASVRPQDGTERFIKRSSITSLCQKKGPHKGPFSGLQKTLHLCNEGHKHLPRCTGQQGLCHSGRVAVAEAVATDRGNVALVSQVGYAYV